MIEIKTAGYTEVKGLSPAVMALAKKQLTIPNPAYHRILKITGNSWAAERDFRYFSSPKGDETVLQFPRGFRVRLKRYLRNKGLEFRETTDFVDSPTTLFKDWPPVELRDYQMPLVNAVLPHPEGVIYAGTGVGKTVVACEITRLLGQKTTVLVPNTVIQDQFYKEFLKWFKYKPGIVGGGKKEIKDVTIATWQSLSADAELLNRLVSGTGVLFVDECQGGVSKERAKILKKFHPTKLYGLTASPFRSKDDGRTEAIFFYLGPILVEHPGTQVTPTVDVIYTRTELPVSFDYNVMVDSMVQNESRNKLIAGLALGEAMSGKKVLILLKRREHCEKIVGLLEGVGAFYADSDDDTRNEVLMEMRSGERDYTVLVGTVSLLAAGLDIPSLEVVIFGADLKSDVILTQGSGRVLRLFEGKEAAKIYDICDNLNPIFKRQYNERYRFYKDKGWEIKGTG